MGLFDKFKKKNVESANKKTETTVETKPDDTFECTLDHLYGELLIRLFLRFLWNGKNFTI